MKTLFLLLIVLCTSLEAVFAQGKAKLDSLKQVLTKLPPEGRSFASDTMRVKVLCEMGEITHQFSEVSTLFNQAISFALKLKTKKYAIIALNQYGEKISNNNNFYKVGSLFFEALLLAEKEKNTELEAQTRYNIGRNYLNLEKNDSARVYLSTSLRINKKNGNRKGILLCYNSIGISYARDKQNAKAIKYYKYCLKINKYYGFQDLNPKLLNNIGIAYEQANMIDSALFYENLAITELTKQRLINSESMMACLIEVSYLWQLKKDYVKAIIYAQKSLIVNPQKHLEYESYSYNMLYRSNKALKKYRDALSNLERYKSIRDNLETLQKDEQLKSLRAEYDLEINNKKLALLSIEVSTQQFQRNVLIGFGSLFLLIVLILWRSNRIVTQKKNKIQEQKIEIEKVKDALKDLNASLEDKVALRTDELVLANEELFRKNQEIREALFKGQTIERKRVASELHDNLGGTLSALKWRLEALNKDGLSEKEKKIHEGILQTMKDAYSEVRLISHNLLPPELEKHGLIGAIEKLMIDLNQSNKIHFEFVSELTNNIENPQVELELYSVSLELVNNILKHSEATQAIISLSILEANDSLIMCFSDDGKGFDGTSSPNGMGIKNITERIESLGGKVFMRNNHCQGSFIQIIVPISPKNIESVRI